MTLVRLFFTLSFISQVFSSEIKELENTISALEMEIKTLARFNLRGDVGAIGFRTQASDDQCRPEWVDIHFGADEVNFDEVILVPALKQDSKFGYQSEAFPYKFSVSVITQEGMTEIGHFEETGEIQNRIAPVTIKCPNTKGIGIRITAKKLSLLGWNNYYYFALSEVFVFDGNTNIALHKKIEASAINLFEEKINGAWNRKHLVDGHTPYIMDAFHGERSIASLTGSDSGASQKYTIDLGEPIPIDSFSFHRTELNDTVPRSQFGTYGIPENISIYGSMTSDFSNQRELANHSYSQIYSVGPIISVNCTDHTPFQYLKFIYNGRDSTHGSKSLSIVGFSEIEAFSNGVNILNRKTFKSDSEILSSRSLKNLTDGRNYYGNILPTKQWLNELSRRHTIETTLPNLKADLSRRYVHQTKIYQVVGISLILCIIIALCLGIWQWYARRREIIKIKDQFASDLHDELGANIHTIGLLSDLAEKSRDTPDAQTKLHQQIRSVTERTGKAIYHMAGMLETSGLYRGIINDMKRASKRIMAQFEDEFNLSGEDIITRLPQRTQIDLFLFYQECLVNISRHTDADFYRTEFHANKKWICLSVEDNGQGFDDLERPRSLQRRAKMIRAKVEFLTSESGGGIIKLKMKTPKLITERPS